MIPQATVKKRKKPDPYLTQRVMSASPAQLISYAYDAAIMGCGQRDRVKVTRAMSELITSLNFEYKEQAMAFYRVYRYINMLIIKGKFDDAKSILVDVKSAWNQAMNLA